MIQFITYFSFAIEILLACFYCPSYGLPFSCYALLMWVLWFFKCIFRWKDVRFWFLKLLELSLNTLQISYYSAYVIRRSVVIFKPIPKQWFPKYFSVSNILFQVFSYLNLFFYIQLRDRKLHDFLSRAICDQVERTACSPIIFLMWGKNICFSVV